VDQNSLIRALAFMLGVVLLLELSWGAYKAVTVARTTVKNTEAVETLDTDAALSNTIDSLEAHWNRRLSYNFKVEQDPLFLGRVVTGFAYNNIGYKEFDEGGVPRLSATVAVFDEEPMAIIKYMGKSYVLQTGDKFGDGYVVSDIKVKSVTLYKNGKKMTLFNKPIGGAYADEDQQGSYQPTEW
jgi:hypothetical protein